MSRNPQLALLGLFVLLAGAIGLVAWSPLVGLARNDTDSEVPAPPADGAVEGPAGLDPGTYTYVEPSPVANPGDLQDYGSFRLIPYGYVGPLPHEETPLDEIVDREATLVNIIDEAAVRDSWLFREPKTMVDGYRLSTVYGVGSTDSAADITVVLVYKGDGFELEIARHALSNPPKDVHLPSSESDSDVLTAMFGDLHAILQRPDEGAAFQGPLVVHFIEGDILTSLQWRTSDPAQTDAQFEELIKVAQSLIQN